MSDLTPPANENATPVAINSMNTLTLKDPNKLYEILYSPNEHYCLALDKTGLQELKRYDKIFGDAATQLETARTQPGNQHDALLAAQANVRKQLQDHAGNTGPASLAPLTTGKTGFSEVIRIGEGKYSLVPSEFIDAYRNKPKNFFKIPGNIASALTEVAHREPVEDALRGWRHTEGDNAGQLNRKKIKDVFGVVAPKIAKEWKLLEGKKEGQISSQLLAKWVVPGITSFFDDDDFAILDKWIAQINKDAGVSTKQYAKYRDNVLKALDKTTDSKEKESSKFFLPEDWDVVLRLVKDIWGEKSDIYRKINRIEFEILKNKQRREKLRDEIAHLPLPPTCWDASAGAQLMRYSLGGTVKAEFNLLAKGKLALGAGAEFDAALAEAKAEGSFYYPNSKGHPLKPKVNIKRETIVYKHYGKNKKDSSTYNLKHDQYLPHFAVDSSVLTPAGAAGVFSTLKAWSVTKQIGNRANTDASNRDMFIQVVGHTSATASEQYNQALGNRRGAIVADFIAQQNTSWIGHFKSGVWGESELDFMAYVILIFQGSIKATIDWSAIGKIDKIIPLVDQLIGQAPDLIQHRTALASGMEKTFFLSRDRWHEPTRNPKITRLQQIVQLYTKTLISFASKENAVPATWQKNLLTGIQLYSDPYISKGETDRTVPTESETYQNRRCEFIAWEIDGDKSIVERKEVEVYFGDIRCHFSGHISAWAGANITLGGEIAVAAPKGVLTVVGAIRDEAKDGKVSDATIIKGKGALSAGGNAGAFAGAKAEVGLKAAIDWRSPPPEDSKDNKLFKPPAFSALGSIGYTVTGLMGIGGKAEFAIGFDQISQRFIVKVKAEAALGPGIGGQLDIVVGVGQCWNFITLIHTELKRNNFSYLDIFETQESESGIDVFDLFSAWSWKMLRGGFPIGAAGTLAVGYFADKAIDLLKNAEVIVDEWNKSQIINDQLDTLIDTLHSKPTLIKYLTPETKGRILYELISTPKNIKERLDNIKSWDINKRREDAAMILIQEGTYSKSDWWETLEHMGELRNGTLMSQITPKQSSAEKSQRVKDNSRILRTELLDDVEKWDTLQHFLNNLPPE